MEQTKKQIINGKKPYLKLVRSVLTKIEQNKDQKYGFLIGDEPFTKTIVDLIIPKESNDVTEHHNVDFLLSELENIVYRKNIVGVWDNHTGHPSRLSQIDMKNMKKLFYNNEINFGVGVHEIYYLITNNNQTAFRAYLGNDSKSNQIIFRDYRNIKVDELEVQVIN